MKNHVSRAAIALVLTSCGVATVRGQCSGYVLEPGPGTLTGTVSALTTWDPDGAGPLPTTVVAGGAFGGARVMVWDGASWQQLGPVLLGGLYSLTTFNGDLVIGSTFTDATGDYGVARWSGTAWERLGTDKGAGVTWAFTVHQGQLWAFGGSSVFRLNGTHWEEMGPFNGEYGFALTSFQGTVIAGGLLRVGTPQAGYGVVRWGGVPNAFEPVGDGWQTFVYDFATTSSGHLLAAGDGGVAEWNGTTWNPIGAAGPTRTLSRVGGLAGELVAGGSTAPYLRRWDGSSWQVLGGGVAGPQAMVSQMVQWNEDLVIGGKFTSVGGVPSGSIARYRCVPCYANCDGSIVAPVLTANDFQCFLNLYAAASSYANCDGSTLNPVLTANDFQCFLNKFAAGCT